MVLNSLLAELIYRPKNERNNWNGNRQTQPAHAKENEWEGKVNPCDAREPFHNCFGMRYLLS